MLEHRTTRAAPRGPQASPVWLRARGTAIYTDGTCIFNIFLNYLNKNQHFQNPELSIFSRCAQYLHCKSPLERAAGANILQFTI